MNILQLIRNGIDQAFIGYKLRNIIIKKFNTEIFNSIYYLSTP
jgi:hypothetical protein